jgi:hypothetical protein
MRERIRRVAKEAPGAAIIIVVAPVTFSGLCLCFWLGPDTICWVIALLIWLLFMAGLVQICAAIDLGKT